MMPTVDEFLRQAARTLTEEILPHLSDDYRAGTVRVIALMLQLAAEEYDRAAEIRLAENRSMRALFAGAAEQVENRQLASRLRDAAAQEEGDYRIQTLDASNEALRRLLIELQVEIEARDDDAPSSIGTAIRDLLERSAERRLLTLPTP